MVKQMLHWGLGEQGSRRREQERRYGLAILAAVLALVIRVLLTPWMADYQPWSTLYVAIVLVGWRLGWAPALVTSMVGLAGGIWFIVPPRYSLAIGDVQHGVQLFTYGAVAATFVWLMRAMHRQQDRLMNATEAIRQQEQEYRASFEVASLGEALIDPGTGRFLRVNEALAHMTGYPAEQLLQMDFPELLHSEERQREQKRFEEIVRAGQSCTSETRFCHREGRSVWVKLSWSLARCPAGRPWRVMAVVEDVSARRRAERALENEKALAQAVIESLPGLFFIIGEDFRLRNWNKNFERLSGFSAPEIRQMTAMDLSAPEDRALVQEKIRQCFSDGEAETELYSLTKDGQRLPYACIGKCLQFGGEHEIIGLGVNISQQKHVEEALKHQNERLTLLNETAAHLLSAAESEEVLHQLYERIARFFKAGVFLAYRANEAEEVLELESCGGVDPEARQKLVRLQFGEGICGTVAQQRRPWVVSHIQQSHAPIAELAKRLGLSVYACNPLIAGGRLLGTLAFACVDRDCFEAEEIEFFQTLASYVAIAKERLRLERQLRERAETLERTVAERTASLREMMGELEHFSYSIVHDMRAPLRAVMGYAELMVRKSGSTLTDQGKDFLRRLMDATARMDLLITDALQYSWAVRSELPLAPVDVAALLRGMLESYPQFQPAHADIRLEGSFPLVLGNAAGLTQCFSNLLSNAIKFVHPGQRPQVTIRAESRQEWVRVWIEDQGVGIPPEAHERIFDMFQRVHTTTYDGTGIGLALVRKVVQRMGGTVGVESEPNHGSRFWLQLRRPAEETAGAAASIGGNEHKR